MYHKKAFFLSSIILMSVFIVSVYADRDNFDSQKLGEKWIWDNPAKDSSYSLKEKPGWLKITCAPGDHDIWDVRSGGPAMLLEAPNDYTFETHYITTILDNCSVGLVFLNEDAVGNANSPGPWCALFTQPGNQLFWQHAVAVDAKQVNVANGNDAYIKVEKTGKDWKFYYKANPNDKWTLIIEDSYDIGKKHYAGLMVKNWNPGPEITGYYDYVETSWQFASAVEPFEKLTTTWGHIRQR
ncbi:MAG: hypothetical protein ACPL7B_10345 [Candidatus Poribacteria bacterium]